MIRTHRRLTAAALALALVVVSLGAWVRLSDAGLGCPDWPGCYGHLVGVPDQEHEQSAALQAFPGKPVEAHKAWKATLRQTEQVEKVAAHAAVASGGDEQDYLQILRDLLGG